jgi:flavin-dependent dehydrogenase
MHELLKALPNQEFVAAKQGPASFLIDATGRAAINARRWSKGKIYRYGKRVALCARAPGHLDVAQMFMTTNCWVFAFPVSHDEIAVQSMVALPPNDPVESLRDAIEACPDLCIALDTDSLSEVACLPSAPQMPDCIATQDGLAVGAAAFAMDPISGDGVGATLRSALLATAVCAEPTAGHISHFVARHRRSFAAHLGHVTDHYSRLTRDPQWCLELRDTFQAVEQTRSLISSNLSYTLSADGLKAAS